MTEANFEFQPVEGGVPIKMWTRGVTVDDKARAQLMRAAQMPFVFKHVAVMPDVHVGIGATIGSVIPTKGAVIPAAVGVDIGCGMMAARTSLMASDLPDNMEGVRAAILNGIGVAVATAWMFRAELHDGRLTVALADLQRVRTAWDEAWEQGRGARCEAGVWAPLRNPALAAESACSAFGASQTSRSYEPAQRAYCLAFRRRLPGACRVLG